MSLKATTEGTERYRKRFEGRAAKNHFREQHGLVLSSLGIGTYLGNADADTDARYASAVVRSVQLGANVIDSAANYRFQRSERSIGQALKTLASDHGISRDELIICTKGGYLPFDGAPPRNVRDYVNETFVKPGLNFRERQIFFDVFDAAHADERGRNAGSGSNKLQRRLRVG